MLIYSETTLSRYLMLTLGCMSVPGFIMMSLLYTLLLLYSLLNSWSKGGMLKPICACIIKYNNRLLQLNRLWMVAEDVWTTCARPLLQELREMVKLPDTRPDMVAADFDGVKEALKGESRSGFPSIYYRILQVPSTPINVSVFFLCSW